jgi:hypothetical protein
LDRLRRDYERVVVELHRSGLPVSELAEQLGCRERDIRWITETRECSFCSRAQGMARLCGGANYDICEFCLTLDRTTAPPASEGDGLGDQPAAGRRCSFCDKVRPDSETMESQVDRNVIICDDCIDFARDWLANESSAGSSG